MKWSLDRANPLALFFIRYKYPILIGLLGVALMLIPFGGTISAGPEPTAEPEPERLSEEAFCRQTEDRLEKILSRIEGAGSVSVMLTLKTSAASRYQTDEKTAVRKDDAGAQTDTEKKTVILSRGGSYNEAAVIQTEYPAFQGALIVSQGADDAAVRYRLLCAVSALLGLGADQITVAKMK